MIGYTSLILCRAALADSELHNAICDFIQINNWQQVSDPHRPLTFKSAVGLHKKGPLNRRACRILKLEQSSPGRRDGVEPRAVEVYHVNRANRVAMAGDI